MFGGDEFSEIKAIKSQSVDKIEDAFSKALEGLTGKVFKVDIKKLLVDENRNESHVELTISL
jgi:hypothetical protein